MPLCARRKTQPAAFHLRRLTIAPLKLHSNSKQSQYTGKTLGKFLPCAAEKFAQKIRRRIEQNAQRFPVGRGGFVGRNSLEKQGTTGQEEISRSRAKSPWGGLCMVGKKRMHPMW